MSNAHHILVIDDDQAMRSMVVDFLRTEGHLVSECELAVETLRKIDSKELNVTDESSPNRQRIDLVITDLSMPEMTGIEFIAKFHPIAPNIPIILITAFGTIETAIDAIRQGAFDYTTKPFKLNEMSATVTRALKFRDLQLENIRLQSTIYETHSFAKIIGKSPGMREVFDLIRRVAPATANVLITGESGTGKERVARAVHDEGPRRRKKFVAINCTAIPEALLESELFGHAKGSFTGAAGKKRGLFEEAEGGTIFLDEIGDMNLALQGKLLRVLQEKKIRAVGDNLDRDVDVRIVAASHKDLKAAIRNGTFREDLYYRLSVIPITIPPLRHRREDIPLLAEHFLKKYSHSNGTPLKRFSPEAMNRIMGMPWEGNVRELENIIERAVVLTRSLIIELKDLPATVESDIESFFGSTQLGTLPTIEEIEKRYFKFVLDKTAGRKEKAAQILGVNRRTLYRKEREYGFIANDGDSTQDETTD